MARPIRLSLSASSAGGTLAPPSRAPARPVLLVPVMLGVLVLAGLCVPTADATEDPLLQDVAVGAYANAHDVPLSEARQAVTLQDRADGIATELEATLGGSYGGVWFDAEDAGRLKFALVKTRGQILKADLQAARQLLDARGITDQADAVGVESSLAGLFKAQRELDADLRNLIVAGRAATAIDPSSNAVVVTTPTASSDAERNSVNSATARSAVPVRRRAISRTDLRPTPFTCQAGLSTRFIPWSTVHDCTRPLRGGIRIDAAVIESRCTLGFNVRGRSDGNPFVLTAGHCINYAGDDLAETAVWDALAPSSGLRDIGKRHFNVTDSRGDAGIIRVTSDSFWLTGIGPQPWVVVSGTASGYTTYNETYRITHEGAQVPGQVVCMSSAIPLGQGYHSNGGFTDCGFIWELNQSIGPLGNMTKVAYCGARPGASGGPFYKNNAAYGVLSSGIPGTCEMYFSPADRAENILNVDIIHG